MAETAYVLIKFLTVLYCYRFANRAKAIKNKPEVNEVSTDKSMIQSLTKEMSILKAQLESKKTLEVTYFCDFLSLEQKIEKRESVEAHWNV